MDKEAFFVALAASSFGGAIGWLADSPNTLKVAVSLFIYLYFATSMTNLRREVQRLSEEVRRG